MIFISFYFYCNICRNVWPHTETNLAIFSVFHSFKMFLFAFWGSVFFFKLQTRDDPSAEYNDQDPSWEDSIDKIIALYTFYSLLKNNSTVWGDRTGGMGEDGPDLNCERWWDDMVCVLNPPGWPSSYSSLIQWSVVNVRYVSYSTAACTFHHVNVKRNYNPGDILILMMCLKLCSKSERSPGAVILCWMILSTYGNYCMANIRERLWSWLIGLQFTSPFIIHK